MEEMVRKVCLDSDVLISLLNKDEKTKSVLESVHAQFYITSVSAFEIWYGRKKSEMISALLQSLHHLELDTVAAQQAADMLRTLKEQGQIIELRDLFIGATCIRNGIELLTFNKKHFERLTPFGLKLVS